MNSKLKTVLSAMITALLSAGSLNLAAQDAKIELLFTYNPYLGVRMDSTLMLYKFQEKWQHYGDWNIILPAETDELVLAPNGQIGVRTGNELKFYEPSGLFGGLWNTDTLDFKLPDNTDELLLSRGGDLGVRSGNQLKFYLYEKEWKPNSLYDFTLPDNVDKLVITSNALLGIQTGRELKFYNVSNKYEHLKDFDFKLPNGVDEIELTTGDELCIRTGKDLKFFRFKEKWEAAPELDFKIEEPEEGY